MVVIDKYSTKYEVATSLQDKPGVGCTGVKPPIF